MKRYATTQLEPGMIVGAPIYSNQGQLILEVGTELTDKLISRLGFYGIYTVAIQDAPVPEPEPTESLPVFTEEPKPEPKKKSIFAPLPKQKVDPNAEPVPVTPSAALSHSQLIRQTPEFRAFQVNYTKEILTLQSSLSFVLNDSANELDTNQLVADISDLIGSTKSTMDLFDMLHNMRQIDDSIYAHSLNVAMIARTMGKWLNFTDREMKIITLCGLLHDLGKTALPIELLTKPGRYTEEEYEAVKQHPMLGYQIIEQQPIDERIKNAVLMHHERCDGSGYPNGLTTEQLDDFSMIIAIADVYDAMTAARSYREPLCPFQVIDAFEKEGLQKYHPKYILTFLENIADTYQHNKVLLNNGQSATIVMINKSHLTQPYIQFSDGTTIDMTSRPDLEIVKIL